MTRPLAEPTGRVLPAATVAAPKATATCNANASYSPLSLAVSKKQGSSVLCFDVTLNMKKCKTSSPCCKKNGPAALVSSIGIPYRTSACLLAFNCLPRVYRMHHVCKRGCAAPQVGCIAQQSLQCLQSGWHSCTSRFVPGPTCCTSPPPQSTTTPSLHEQ